MYNDILTEADETITVRRLRIFELDLEVLRPRPKPYIITIEGYGGSFQQVFNLSVSREEPSTPQELCEENTLEWYDWREYLRYKEGVLHYKKILELMLEYYEKVAQYILETCVPEDQHNLIITENDWNGVYCAALCPEVELEDLKYVTHHIFMAEYNGFPLFDSFESIVEGGLGAYLSIRAWEVRLRKELRMTEEEYTQLGIMDRAIMLMAEKIPEMITQIDMENQRKVSRAKTNENRDTVSQEPSSV